MPTPYEVIKKVPYPVHVPQPYPVIHEKKVPVEVKNYWKTFKNPYFLKLFFRNQTKKVIREVDVPRPYPVVKHVPVEVKVAVDRPYPV